MHPDLAWNLCRQQRRELAARADDHRVHPAVRRRRRLPRWNVSWTRLAPGDLPGARGQARSSWMIIISAGRPG